MADFRKEDEVELQDIREKLEKGRVEETGEASSSRNKREYSDSTDSSNYNSDDNEYTYKPPKKK
jgi:hypothetical protein